MATQLNGTNVWQQMDYTPPRGPCNFKAALLSPACPCLRFMLHPLKSATSFNCDGCGHHASYHSMQNKAEEEITRRWREEEQAKTAASTTSQNGRAGAGNQRKKRARRDASPEIELISDGEVGTATANGRAVGSRRLIEATTSSSSLRSSRTARKQGSSSAASGTQSAWDRLLG